VATFLPHPVYTGFSQGVFNALLVHFDT